MDRSYGYRYYFLKIVLFADMFFLLHVFCCFFRFKTLRRVYKINKFREIPGYKKHRRSTSGCMLQQWELLTSRSEFGTCCATPKKWRTLKTFEKLYSSHLKIADLVFSIPYDVSFQPMGVVCIYVVSYQIYLKQPCINLLLEMTRRVLNFGSDWHVHFGEPDVSKLFCHKIQASLVSLQGSHNTTSTHGNAAFLLEGFLPCTWLCMGIASFSWCRGVFVGILTGFAIWRPPDNITKQNN